MLETSVTLPSDKLTVYMCDNDRSNKVQTTNESDMGDTTNNIYDLLLFIINILTAIGLAPGGSSPVHIYRELYIEYTNNAQNTQVQRITK